MHTKTDTISSIHSRSECVRDQNFMMVFQSAMVGPKRITLLICSVVAPLTFAHPATDTVHSSDPTCATPSDAPVDRPLRQSSACDAAVPPDDIHARSPVTAESLIYERLRRERAAENVRSILTGHKRNYVLPFSYNRSPNQMPFVSPTNSALNGESLHRSEIKFQLSLKSSIWRPGIVPDDAVYIGFTTTAWWQAFNQQVSAPFRETNYEPELFWVTPLRSRTTDAAMFGIGISHQSNGRGGELSRSWNRIYSSFVWEKNRFVFSFKPWWRIPEDMKTEPGAAIGDDNPDIEDFLGHFEFQVLYRRQDHEWGMMWRHNFDSDSRGAVQLDWTFPLWRGLRGSAQYFNGYGESLIDYNAHTERFGIGIQLTDIL